MWLKHTFKSSIQQKHLDLKAVIFYFVSVWDILYFLRSWVILYVDLFCTYRDQELCWAQRHGPHLQLLKIMWWITCWKEVLWSISRRSPFLSFFLPACLPIKISFLFKFKLIIKTISFTHLKIKFSLLRNFFPKKDKIHSNMIFLVPYNFLKSVEVIS